MSAASTAYRLELWVSLKECCWESVLTQQDKGRHALHVLGCFSQELSRGFLSMILSRHKQVFHKGFLKDFGQEFFRTKVNLRAFPLFSWICPWQVFSRIFYHTCVTYGFCGQFPNLKGKTSSTYQQCMTLNAQVSKIVNNVWLWSVHASCVLSITF